MGKEQLPNVITIGNAFIGILAIMYIFDKSFKISILLIFLCVIIDGIDGMLARYLKIDNKKGKYLDSISDMFAFCLAPAMLIYGIHYDIEKALATFDQWERYCCGPVLASKGS